MPRLRTSSCPYTIRPVTLRLKAYPEYPNPTRDRPGWERRWYHRTWRYDDNDTSFYRNKDIAGCTDNHIWLSEQPYGRPWVYESVRIPDLVFYYRYFKYLKSLFDRLPSGMIAWIRMYRTFYLPDSVIVPAVRFFSAAVAFFLVASWLPDGKSHLHHNHEL